MIFCKKNTKLYQLINSKNTMKKIFIEIYKNNKLILYLTLFFASIMAWADIIGWIIQKNILDNIVLTKNFTIILWLIILLFLSYLINQIFWALTYYFSNKFWEIAYRDYKKRALIKFNRIKFDIIVDKRQWEINEIISKWTQSLYEIINRFFWHIIIVTENRN